MIDVLESYNQRSKEITKERAEIYRKLKTPAIQNDPTKRAEYEEKDRVLGDEACEILKEMRKLKLQKLRDMQTDETS